MVATANKRLKHNSIYRMPFGPKGISNIEDKHVSNNRKEKHWKYLRWTNDSPRHYQNSRPMVREYKKNIVRSEEMAAAPLEGYENSSVSESYQNFMEDIRPVVVIDVDNSPGRRISNYHSRPQKQKMKSKQFGNNSDNELRPIVFEGTLVPLDIRAVKKYPSKSNANIEYQDTRDVINQNYYPYRNKGHETAAIDTQKVRNGEKTIKRQNYPSRNRGMYMFRNEVLTDEDLSPQKANRGSSYLHKSQEDILPAEIFQETIGQNEGHKFQKHGEVPMTNFKKKPYLLLRAQGKNNGRTRNYLGHKKNFSLPAQRNFIVESRDDPYAYQTKETSEDIRNIHSNDQLKKSIYANNYNNWQSKKTPVVQTKYIAGTNTHKFENRETTDNHPTVRVKYLQIRFPNNTVVNKKMAFSSHFSPEFSKKIYRIETEVPLSTEYPDDEGFVRPKHINENVNNYAKEMRIEGPPSKITELVPLEDLVASSTENLQSNNSEITTDGVEMKALKKEDLENKLSKKKINIHIIGSKNNDLALNKSNSSFKQGKKNNLRELEDKVGKFSEDNLGPSFEVITHNILSEMQIAGSERKRQVAEDDSPTFSSEMNNVHELMNPAVAEVQYIDDESALELTTMKYTKEGLNENIIYDDPSQSESMPSELHNANEGTAGVFGLRKHSDLLNSPEEISFLPLVHSDVPIGKESITSIARIDVHHPEMGKSGFSSIPQQESLDNTSDDSDDSYTFDDSDESNTFDDSDESKFVNVNDEEIDDIFGPIEEKQDFVTDQSQLLSENFYSINDNEKYTTEISKFPIANENQGINFIEIPKELSLRGTSNNNMINGNVDYADNFLPLAQTMQPDVSIHAPPSESEEGFPFRIQTIDTNSKQFLISKVEKPGKTDGNVGRNKISVYPFETYDNKQDVESPKVEGIEVSLGHDNVPKQVETSIINRKIESETVELQKEIPLQNVNDLYRGGSRAETKTVTSKNHKHFGLGDLSNDQSIQLNANANKQTMAESKSNEIDLDKQYVKFQHDLNEMKPFTEYSQAEEHTLRNTHLNNLVDSDNSVYAIKKKPFFQQYFLKSKTTEYPKAVTTKYEISFLKSEIEIPSSDANNIEHYSNFLEAKHEDESDQYLEKDKMRPNKIIRTLEKKIEVFSQ